MTGEHFQRFAYILWFVTTALELVVFLCLRAKSRSAGVRAAKRYLLLKLVMFTPLYVSSLFWHEAYFWVYFLDSILNQAALFVICAALHYDVRGKARVFGSVRAWIVSCAFIGIALGYSIIVTPPSNTKPWFTVFFTVEQELTYAVGLCLLGIALYAWLAASSYPAVPALIWAGTAIYVAADSFSWESALLNHFAPVYYSHHIPTFIFFITLYLWHRAESTCKKLETS